MHLVETVLTYAQDKTNPSTDKEIADMKNQKMVAAIEKAFGKVEIKNIDEENLVVEFETTEGTFTAQLQERKNQYGPYYRMVASDKVEEKIEEKMDEEEAVASLKAAQILSAEKKITVWVMSNGKRTAAVKTENNVERHKKYGYWVAQIFELGLPVSA